MERKEMVNKVRSTPLQG